MQADSRNARRSRRPLPETFAAWLVVAIVAWGVLSFGAVYPWGYGPLAAAALVAGAHGLTSGRVRRIPRLIAASLAVVVATIALQIVPLPPGALARISPATVGLLSRYDVMFALARGSEAHALSVDPDRTMLGLLMLVCLGTFWLGLTAIFRERLIVRIVRGILIVGVAVALIGIVGPSGQNARIYGFWQPQSVAVSFGPFVNRNHYAGWMLMTIPLGLGYLFALADREIGAASWRSRLVWLSTPSASVLILVAAALTVMTMSVFLSLSRSGIACLVVGVVAVVCAACRTRAGGTRRAIDVALAAAIAVGCLGWVGADKIGGRFAEFQADRLGGRGGVWRDAVTVARSFPVAGTGLDTFGVAMLFYQTGRPDEFYAEAHSDYLQLGAEGGVLVGIPVLLLVLFTARDVRQRLSECRDDRRSYWLRLGAIGGLFTIALQETSEFSLQMPGNAVLFCVLAAIALHRSDRAAARSFPLQPAS